MTSNQKIAAFGLIVFLILKCTQNQINYVTKYERMKYERRDKGPQAARLYLIF